MKIGMQSPGWPHQVYANGITKYVALMRPALEALGHEVHVMAAEVQPGHQDRFVWDMALYSRSIGLPHRILRRLAPNAVNRSQIRRRWLSVLKQKSLQLDLLQMEDSFGMAGWLCNSLPIPIIVRLHGPWFVNGEALGVPQDAAFKRRVNDEGRALAQVAGITAPSQDIIDRTREYYGLRLPNALAVPNPAPSINAKDCWEYQRCNRNNLFFVGRFDRHKGGDIVIDAFHLVKQRYPNLTLTFVGPDRGIGGGNGKLTYIRDYVAKSGRTLEEAGIRYLGEMSYEAVIAQRQQALLTLVASRYETFGNTIIESLTQGCPTIASSMGGANEIIKDGVTGLLFRPTDATQLAQRIFQLLENTDLAVSLGGNARKDVMCRFDRRALARQTLDYYADVIDRHTHGERKR